MKNQWQNLTTRERMTIISGILLVSSIIGFFSLNSIYQELIQLRHELPLKKAELSEMENIAKQVSLLRQAEPVNNQDGDKESPLSLIDRTAASCKLTSAVKRVEPDDQNQIKIWLKNGNYNNIIKWFKLLQENGIQIYSFTAESLDEPGLVNARISLKGSQ